MEPTCRKLLDRVRDAIRLKHYSIRTEEAYVHWIKRCISLHTRGHPAEMGAPEIEAFLTHLAVHENVFPSGANTSTLPCERVRHSLDVRAAVLHSFLRRWQRFSTSGHPKALVACYAAA